MNSTTVRYGASSAGTAASDVPNKAAATFLVLHIVILFAGFSLLAAAFDFPEVLRYPAAERLALFRENQSVVLPTYWALAMSGFTQISLTILLARAIGPRAGTAGLLALVFGIACGAFQAIGFGRWAVLIPWLAGEMAAPDLSPANAAALAYLEGAFNRFAGMLVGEHLANIAWGLWMLFTGIAILKAKVLDTRMGWAAICLSPIFAVLAAEQVGFASETALSLINDYGFPLLAVFQFGLAWQLVRRDGTAIAPRLNWGAGIAALILYPLMVLPAITG